MTKNKLFAVAVRRGAMPETEVAFHRHNRGCKYYYPQANSLRRLEPHLKDCEIMLAPGWLTIEITNY